jgi:hypothetical protein
VRNLNEKRTLEELEEVSYSFPFVFEEKRLIRLRVAGLD